ncbi:DMT family transporter [Candidatus Albibeggiatoa sp. nov. BB20]|uniref:DMT family transporter n=1 Tax=Candidatus Albibeggiatoa sp. nov. BB20 TaxID=3162723 RepID=UPI003365B0A3
MLETDLLTIFFALGAVVTWGSGDFTGGFVTKRHPVYSTLLTGQLISIIPFFVLALSFEFVVPRMDDVLLSCLAGLGGMVGLLNLYSGLAQGRMSVVAPLVAITASILPIFVGIFTDGIPTLIQITGFFIAISAVWLLSSNGRQFDITSIELRFALTSGLGFAIFFILIDRISGDTALWPIVAARFASITALSLYVISRREWKPPTKALLPLMVLTGLFDTTGSYFFMMAAQVGRLDIATVISSLYPAITVILAWLILKERLKISQWFGVATALISVVMIIL